MAVTDAGSDKATAALTGAGSQDATNTIAEPPPFAPQGSVSAASYQVKITPLLPPIPEQAGAHIAGPGDKGGILASGADPQSDGPWKQSGEDTGRWTTSRPVGNYKDI